MKNRLKILIALGVFTLTLKSNFFIAYAENDIPQEPTKPDEIVGELNNNKIQEYNQEVNQYNEAVDDYNQQVDNYNNQIDEEYNQQLNEIDKQNEAIDEYNKQEDKKAATIKEENEQIQTKYDEDYAKYEEALTAYQNKEQQILALGYKSVEDYNNTVNSYYNDPYNEGLEKNADENAVFDIDQSYTIEKVSEDTENEEENSTTYTVEIKHNFKDEETLVKSYETNFEIGKNDIITFKSAGAQSEVFKNEYHYGFFTFTDEDHLGGYWYESDSILFELCNYVESDWEEGDTHTVSYKDGERTSGDTGLVMTYNYKWKPLKQVKTYTEPEEPILELKEEYTPQYKDKVEEPIKKEHLNYLKYIDTLDLLPEESKKEPEPEQKKEDPKPEQKVEKEESISESKIEQPVVKETKEEEKVKEEVTESKPIEIKEEVTTESKPIETKEEVIESKTSEPESEPIINFNWDFLFNTDENNEDAGTAFDPQPEEIIYETSVRETPPAAVLGEVRKRDNTSTSIVKNNSQSPKAVLGARKGQTDDIISTKKRYAIIIGCLATIALLSYIDIIRKKEEKENNQDLSS